MANITKAVLVQQIKDLTAALEAASAALEAAEKREAANRELFEIARNEWRARGAEIEALRAEQAAHTTPTRRVQRAGYVAPAWQAERAAAMAAAKEAAVRLGRTCKVCV